MWMRGPEPQTEAARKSSEDLVIGGVFNLTGDRGGIPETASDNITNNGKSSLYGHRFDELSRQKALLDREEAELNGQRRDVQREKDRIARTLKRIDRKQDLEDREETVKKQRMILEIEKKQLREDIGELDQLKRVLEGRRREAHVGFSDLAESNKDMKSLKSGDLHRERSQLLFSKQSMRSKVSRDGAGAYHAPQSSLEPGMLNGIEEADGAAANNNSFDARNNGKIIAGAFDRVPSKMIKTGMPKIDPHGVPGAESLEEPSDVGYRRSFADYADNEQRPDLHSAETTQ
jgi:hypothetical protein